ncbi:hypothetical protein DFH09DRAFT_1144266 [Mycena vulgaris]|nr:hypothetical protein DFH09DRAFT_1144266 [Mycena vulgaris]
MAQVCQMPFRILDDIRKVTTQRMALGVSEPRGKQPTPRQASTPARAVWPRAHRVAGAASLSSRRSPPQCSCAPVHRACRNSRGQARDRRRAAARSSDPMRSGNPDNDGMRGSLATELRRGGDKWSRDHQERGKWRRGRQGRGRLRSGCLWSFQVVRRALRSRRKLPFRRRRYYPRVSKHLAGRRLQALALVPENKPCSAPSQLVTRRRTSSLSTKRSITKHNSIERQRSGPSPTPKK